MKVYFEKIRFYHYPIVKYFLARKCEVYMFNFDFEARKIKWLRDLMDSGLVKKIPHYMAGNDKLAIDNVEKISGKMLAKSRIVKSMSKLYGDSNILLAYKKILTKRLSDFYSMQLVLKSKSQKLADDGKIVLFPYRYTETLNLLSRYEGFRVLLPQVITPKTYRHFNCIERAALKTKSGMQFFFINTCFLGIVLLKALRPGSKQEKLEYRYALPVTNTQFQFKFKEHRAFDFLLDEKSDINKENTVFMLFRPLNKEQTTDLKIGGYNYVDCNNKKVFVSSQFSFRKNIFSKVLRYMATCFFSAFFELEDIVTDSNKLLYTYVQWTLILDNLKISQYITFNDEGISHVGRTVLFHKRGVESWLYAHSCAFGFANTNEDMGIDAAMRMHWAWAFLFYDNYVAWNNETIKFQKLHRQKIGRYHNVGCLWADFIVKEEKKMALGEYLKKQNVTGKHVAPNFKVVSFFDTSFFESEGSQYPMEEGILFYADILKLLEEEKDLFVIMKEKKTREVYSDIDYFVYSPLNVEHSDMINKLADHPRCYTPGPNGDPTDIIKVSDLTVTYAFSSSTIEALSARKKAIFYHPTVRFRKYHYDNIPGLVVHGYDELKEMVHRLAYDTEDAEYDRYLNSEILGRVDEHLDGKALERFRELLIRT